MDIVTLSSSESPVWKRSEVMVLKKKTVKVEAVVLDEEKLHKVLGNWRHLSIGPLTSIYTLLMQVFLSI